MVDLICVVAGIVAAVVAVGCAGEVRLDRHFHGLSDRYNDHAPQVSSREREADSLRAADDEQAWQWGTD